MSDLPQEPVGERNYTGFLIGLGALALLVAIGGLIWSYKLSSRLDKSEAALTKDKKQMKQIRSMPRGKMLMVRRTEARRPAQQTVVSM